MNSTHRLLTLAEDYYAYVRRIRGEWRVTVYDDRDDVVGVALDTYGACEIAAKEQLRRERA